MVILFLKIERKYQAFKHEENKYKCLKSGVELFHACLRSSLSLQVELAENETLYMVDS